MNFLKWVANIVIEWILYIPKKIIQIIEENVSMKEMSWRKVENFLTMPKYGSGPLPMQSTNFDKLLTATLFLILAILLDENFITSCLLCQSIITFMSSYFPSMIEMAHHSAIPQIVLFELSFAYAVMPLFVLIFFFRNRKISYEMVETLSTRFMFRYFLIFSFLCFMTYISIQNEVSFLFPQNEHSRLLDVIVQTKIGVSLWIWLLTFLTAKSFAIWIFMNIAIIKSFIHKEKSNEAQ